MRYYHVGCGCKKLHPPLLPGMPQCLAMRHGTTAPEHGTTVYGADVKNYILPYYCLHGSARPELAVLPLKWSGTTVGAHGTTVGTHGTTVGACGSTAFVSSTTASL